MLKKTPKWRTMNSRFFHKRITAVCKHVGSFGLQSRSIQLNCSNFWVSHITHHKFKMCAFLGSVRIFFACLRQPLDWSREKLQIHRAPNGASNRFFFFLGVAILLGKTTINSTTVCFAPDFFFAFPHAAPDTCFVYFFDFFVHQIVLFFAFLRAP